MATARLPPQPLPIARAHRIAINFVMEEIKKTWSLTNQPWALSVVELGDLSRRQCSHLQPGFAFRPVTAAVGGVQLLHSFQAAMHLHTGSRAHGSCVQQSQQATDLFGMIFMDEERPLFFRVVKNCTPLGPPGASFSREDC